MAKSPEGLREPEESLETTRIYSAVAQLEPGQPLLLRRPFRAPHHTISEAGLVGGSDRYGEHRNVYPESRGAWADGGGKIVRLEHGYLPGHDRG